MLRVLRQHVCPERESGKPDYFTIQESTITRDCSVDTLFRHTSRLGMAGQTMAQPETTSSQLQAQSTQYLAGCMKNDTINMTNKLYKGFF